MVIALRDDYPVKRVAEVLDVPRSCVYRENATGPRALEDAELLKEIKQIFDHHKQCYGSPRIYAELKSRGVICGENRVARLMKKNGLVAVHAPSKKPKTTDSRHGGAVAPNRLKTLDITCPNQAWAMDITYLKTNIGWIYLAAVLDLFLHKIVGWEVSNHNDSALTEGALKHAAERQNYPNNVLIHSDRGSQYASDGFIGLAESLGYIRSMSAKGNCYDNATMESFFGVAKREDFDRWEMEDLPSVRARVFDYIEVYYNRERIHTALGMSPAEFEKQIAVKTPSAEFFKASNAPQVGVEKAGELPPRPRPVVALSEYPSVGCSPAEPASVSSNTHPIQQIVIENNNKKEYAPNR